MPIACKKLKMKFLIKNWSLKTKHYHCSRHKELRPHRPAAMVGPSPRWQIFPTVFIFFQDDRESVACNASLRQLLRLIPLQRLFELSGQSKQYVFFV